MVEGGQTDYLDEFTDLTGWVKYYYLCQQIEFARLLELYLLVLQLNHFDDDYALKQQIAVVSTLVAANKITFTVHLHLLCHFQMNFTFVHKVC